LTLELEPRVPAKTELPSLTFLSQGKACTIQAGQHILLQAGNGTEHAWLNSPMPLDICQEKKRKRTCQPSAHM
jgi:hypothetical protein